MGPCTHSNSEASEDQRRGDDVQAVGRLPLCISNSLCLVCVGQMWSRINKKRPKCTITVVHLLCPSSFFGSSVHETVQTSSGKTPFPFVSAASCRQ